MNIVLLSGGSGKRLWPLSNDVRSKQFIRIFQDENGEYHSMVQRVFRQIKKADPEAAVTIATSKSQVSAIHNQLGGNVGISVEPCRRDTFPAIALAAFYLRCEKDPGIPVCGCVSGRSLCGGFLFPEPEKAWVTWQGAVRQTWC